MEIDLKENKTFKAFKEKNIYEIREVIKSVGEVYRKGQRVEVIEHIMIGDQKVAKLKINKHEQYREHIPYLPLENLGPVIQYKIIETKTEKQKINKQFQNLLKDL